MSSDKERVSTALEDILFLQKNIYEKIGLKCTSPKAEAESKEYSAFNFKIGARNVVYRVAKITPTKSGQFVTVWKRLRNGPIQPYDFSDEIDFFIISVTNGSLSGQFIFPKLTLLNKEIISGNNKDGKRGFRVYSPWDVTLNKQAQKTQKWQLKYFLNLTGEVIDLERAGELLIE